MIHLNGKTAVIYGVSNSISGTVATTLAKAGALVYLTARRLECAEIVAEQIVASGGLAEAQQVDALNENAVNCHLQQVTDKTGSLDISFNLINLNDIQGTPLIDMSVNDFLIPVQRAMQTHFTTATAAGRIMCQQGSGIILSLTATPGSIGYPLVGGFGPACSAIETFSKNLASELGTMGVRVVNIRSAGSPDSRPFRQIVERDADVAERFFSEIARNTMLKKLPMMQDVANVATFLCSDLASMITGTTIDITAGTTGALNHSTHDIPFT